MRSKLEVRRELKKIEALMEASQVNDASCNVAYGAYTALTWLLEGRLAASEALEVMEAWAEHQRQDAPQTNAEGGYSDLNEGALP